jgi:hypothetical protein
MFAIDVAEQLVPGDGPRTAKHKIKPLGAKLVALDMGLMPDLQFVSRLSSAFFVAKENDFGLREQQRPAFQRIALNDSVVAAEGFRGRKERQHFLLLVCSTSRANLLL